MQFMGLFYKSLIKLKLINFNFLLGCFGLQRKNRVCLCICLPVIMLLLSPNLRASFDEMSDKRWTETDGVMFILSASSPYTSMLYDPCNQPNRLSLFDDRNVQAGTLIEVRAMVDSQTAWPLKFRYLKAREGVHAQVEVSEQLVLQMSRGSRLMLSVDNTQIYEYSLRGFNDSKHLALANCKSAVSQLSLYPRSDPLRLTTASIAKAEAFNIEGDSTALITSIYRRYEPLPERMVSVFEQSDRTVHALYAAPTSAYPHGILGDALEAQQLLVHVDSKLYVLHLADDYVFEDIQPRLVDVDQDGQPEIITIRSHVERGAGILIYKIVGDELLEYAWVSEIGRANRWLNIAAIYDLNGDDQVDLAWVQTPHIGGTLHVTSIKPGELMPVSSQSRYSNHSIGERNLCLSVLSFIKDDTNGNGEGEIRLFIPTQDKAAIQSFKFDGKSLIKGASIAQSIDFSQPLSQQYPFDSVVQSQGNCI